MNQSERIAKLYEIVVKSTTLLQLAAIKIRLLTGEDTDIALAENARRKKEALAILDDMEQEGKVDDTKQDDHDLVAFQDYPNLGLSGYAFGYRRWANVNRRLSRKITIMSSAELERRIEEAGK